MNMASKLGVMAAAIAGLLVAAPASMAAEAAGGARVEAVAEEAASDTRDVRPINVRDIEIRQELPVEHWLAPGEYVWDPEAAAAARGRTIVVVNLRSRTLSAYKGGIEIGRSSILYGAPDKPTPLGTFPVLQKRRDHVSSIYGAPMPHMMRLTWDGVALHGSAIFADDRATNGCVGLPPEFAALLFEHVQVGDRVVIWSGRAHG